MSQPFELWQSKATEAFVMTIPRREFDVRLATSEPRVVGLDLTTGLGRIIRDLAIALFDERDVLDKHQFDAISDRLVELICMLLLGDNRPPGPGPLGELDAAVRRHVRANAYSADLTPRASEFVRATPGKSAWALRARRSVPRLPGPPSQPRRSRGPEP